MLPTRESVHASLVRLHFRRGRKRQRADMATPTDRLDSERDMHFCFARVSSYGPCRDSDGGGHAALPSGGASLSGHVIGRRRGAGMMRGSRGATRDLRDDMPDWERHGAKTCNCNGGGGSAASGAERDGGMVVFATSRRADCRRRG